MSKVSLFFEILQDNLIEKQISTHKVIRLKVGVQFLSEYGWTKPYPAIVDPGAHTSVIPLSIWKNLIHEKIGEYKMFGVSKKEEYAVPVNIGRISCILVDEFGSQTRELNCISFLAKTDKVPLLVGFKDILEKLNLASDFKRNVAYVEDL